MKALDKQWQFDLSLKSLKILPVKIKEVYKRQGQVLQVLTISIIWDSWTKKMSTAPWMTMNLRSLRDQRTAKRSIYGANGWLSIHTISINNYGMCLRPLLLLQHALSHQLILLFSHMPGSTRNTSLISTEQSMWSSSLTL